MNVMVPGWFQYTSSGEIARFRIGTGQVNFAGRGQYPPIEFADEFSDYEQYIVPGWDGYDAVPISKTTVSAARIFSNLLPRDVPRPDIAPGADGTIGFEWRLGTPDSRSYIQVDVGPGDLIIARTVDQKGKVHSFRRTKIHTGAQKLIQRLFS